MGKHAHEQCFIKYRVLLFFIKEYIYSWWTKGFKGQSWGGGHTYSLGHRGESTEPSCSLPTWPKGLQRDPGLQRQEEVVKLRPLGKSFYTALPRPVIWPQTLFPHSSACCGEIPRIMFSPSFVAAFLPSPQDLCFFQAWGSAPGAEITEGK